MIIAYTEMTVQLIIMSFITTLLELWHNVAHRRTDQRDQIFLKKINRMIQWVYSSPVSDFDCGYATLTILIE